MPDLLLTLWLACSGGATTDSDAIESRDSGSGSGTDEICNSTVGVTAPLESCRPEHPCEATGDGSILDEPSTAPACVTTNTDRTTHDDGPPQQSIDADGVTRSWCATSSEDTRRPLVIWFHGAGGSADHVYDYTSLRDKASDWIWADGSRGFHLISVQGRNLHWPTADARDMSHHDIYHRDLASPSGNRDVELADELIDAWVDSGQADPARIYVMGWSNGGFFAQLYGAARHQTPTPGGNRVAAAAVFSAADPFNDTQADDGLACQLDPYPDVTVPIHLTSRSCDLIACDQDQADAFLEDDYLVAPGAIVGPWSSWLSERLGSGHVWQLVDAYGETDESCTSPTWCPLWVASLNHVRWPDGVADGSGLDQEEAMLAFLEAHGGR